MNRVIGHPDTGLVLFIRPQARHKRFYEELRINVLKNFIEHHFFFKFLIQEENSELPPMLKKADILFVEGVVEDKYASMILNCVKRDSVGLLYFNAAEGKSVDLFSLISSNPAEEKYRKIRFSDSLPVPFKPLEGLMIDHVKPELVRTGNSQIGNPKALAYLVNDVTNKATANPAIIIGTYGRGKVTYSAIPPSLQNWFYIGHNDIFQSPRKSPPFLPFCFQWLMNTPYARFYPTKNGAAYEYMIRFDDIDFNCVSSRTKTYFNTWLERTNYPINIAIVPRNMNRNPSLVCYLTELSEKYGKRFCLLKHGSDHGDREIGEYTGVVSVDCLNIKRGLDEFERALGFPPRYSAEPGEEAPIHILDAYTKDKKIRGVCTAIIPTSYGLGGGFHSVPYKSLIVIPTTSRDVSYAKKWEGTITKLLHPQSPKTFMKKASLLIKYIKKGYPYIFSLIVFSLIPELEALRHIHIINSLNLDEKGIALTYEEKTLIEHVKTRIRKSIQYDDKQNTLTVLLNCLNVPLDMVEHTRGITIEIVPQDRKVKSIYLDDEELNFFSREDLCYAILPKLSPEEHCLRIHFD